jgi:glycosyltransferase involved in cell wall biosynthesis
MPDNSQSQTTVLIAASLKPVKDIRAWGKLGISLRETSKYKVNIIGFSAKKIEKSEEANFYYSMAFGRSRWDRIRAMARFTELLLKIRPELVICCTYEYLPIARFFKKIIGFKIVYDVQENYEANLWLNPLLTENKRKQLGKIIHRMEQPNGIDLFLFAESCYKNEMPEKTPFLILENKFVGNIQQISPKNYHDKKQFKFLISGTLTPAYGTVEAITWYREIHTIYPGSSLRIIGHVSLDFYRKIIEETTANDPSIFLELSNIPVPHSQLLHAYANTDFLLLPYQEHAAIRDKMPTKLYEAAALGIPVLHSPNALWETFSEAHSSGFPIDFSKNKLVHENFNEAVSKSYFTKSPDSSLLWSSQSQKFIEAISSLLKE